MKPQRFLFRLKFFLYSVEMIPQNLRITVNCTGFHQISRIFLSLDIVFLSVSKVAWSRIIFLSLKVLFYLYIWYNTNFLQLHHIVNSCLLCSPSPSGLPLHLQLMIRELALSKNNQLNQPLPRILRIQTIQQNIPSLSQLHFL